MADSLLMGKPPFLIIFQGMKKSGKSVLIKHIIWSYRDHFAYIVVFSGSEQVNDAYGSFLPKKYIHSKYEADVMKSITEKQKKFKQAGKDVHCLIIFDDCLGEGFDWRKPTLNPELITLATSNRHYNISIAICSQSPRLIPPTWRSNADYVFLFRHLNQAVGDLYAQLSPMKRKEWEEFYDKNTSDFRIIMFTTHAQKNSDLLTVFTVPRDFMNHKFKLLY